MLPVAQAVGQPEYIRGDWVKPGAAVVDVGINFIPRVGSVSGSASSPSSLKASLPENPLDAAAGLRLVGDVCFEEVSRVAAFISPVPGGVGPMTVAMLMDNTLRSFIRHALHTSTPSSPSASASAAPRNTRVDLALKQHHHSAARADATKREGRGKRGRVELRRSQARRREPKDPSAGRNWQAEAARVR